MEESKRTQKRDDNGKESPDRIIDLTSDMALPNDNGGRIIDLTDVLYTPPEVDAPSAPPAVAGTDAAEEAEPAAEAPPSSMEMDPALPPEGSIDTREDAADEMAEPVAFLQEPLPDPEQGRMPATAVEAPPLEASAPTTAAADDDPTDISPPPEAAAPAQAPETPTVRQSLDEELIDLGDAAPVDAHGAADDALPDEALIELTDIVSPAELARIAAAATLPDDEEIIELTDVVPPEELERIMQDLSLAEEDAPIQLTDIVTPEELARIADEAAQGQEADEPVVELTDIVAPVEAAATLDTDAGDAPAIDWKDTDRATEMAAETEVNETAAVDDMEGPVADAPEATLAAEEAPAAMAPEPAQPGDWIGAEMDETPAAIQEDPTEVTDEAPAPDLGQLQPGDWLDDDAEADEERVIRLDTVLERMRRHEQRLSDDITQGIETELQRQGWAADEAGAEAETAADERATAAQAPTEINAAALERAIERVIRTQYAQTIEKTIATVVEQVVTREMGRIRQELLEEEGPQE